MNLRLALVLLSLSPFAALAASPSTDSSAPAGKSAKKEGKSSKKKADAKNTDKKATPQ